MQVVQEALHGERACAEGMDETVAATEESGLTKSIAVQANLRSTVDTVVTQTDAVEVPSTSADPPTPAPMDTESISSSSIDTTSVSDPEYRLEEDEGDFSDEEDEAEEQQPPEEVQSCKVPLHKERTFIVFISSFMALLTWCHCPRCGCQDTSNQVTEVGTLLIMILICKSCMATSVWHSQPYCCNIPAGNILLSAAILFAGATASKVLRVFRHMDVSCITTRTFFRHQNNVLIPAVHTLWDQQQKFANFPLPCTLGEGPEVSDVSYNNTVVSPT